MPKQVSAKWESHNSLTGGVTLVIFLLNSKPGGGSLLDDQSTTTKVSMEAKKFYIRQTHLTKTVFNNRTLHL